MDDKDSRETYAHRSDEVIAPSAIDNSRIPEQGSEIGDCNLNPETKPEKRRMSRFERVTIGLTVVIAIATDASGVIFYFQWQEMKSASNDTQQVVAKSAALVEATGKLVTQETRVADDAEAELSLAQRPYMETFGTPEMKVFKNPNADTSQYILSLHFTNYGKAPAIDVQEARDVEVGPDALKKIHVVPLGPSKSINPPSKEDFFSAVSKPTAIVPDMTKDNTVAVFVRFQYSGLDGKRYETWSCMAHLATGAWMYCPTHNEIRDCQKQRCEK